MNVRACNCSAPLAADAGPPVGSPSTTHWSVYDGQRGRPRAAAVRAVCACGWRSPARYRLDVTVEDVPRFGQGPAAAAG
ncbi:hypothetical protein OHB39_39270 [Streptomyces sp. NBC_00047]|uniref:hypothetical protein n=1 Tax=Streptomyces sp. NBC_00047 TaxID=2975627 RepID=UPI0022500234|nr:hypothetical protein [Streptomyces sp. NBC_00047]MCX5613488.1 hypothetical protein [Streptomyces sp. NBC_00047]